MKPEELQLWERLNACPQFKQGMGEYIYKDRLWHIFGELEVLFLKILESHEYVVLNKYGCGIAFPREDFNEQFLRLPLTIDDSSPEAHKRSLCGMVDWGRFELRDGGNGSLYIYTMGTFDRIIWEYQGTPTIAILKALLAQWEG